MRKPFFGPTIYARTRVHTVEKRYKCPVCDKVFGDAGIRLRHMRVHSGEKPYKCSTCEKSFSGYGNLRNHVRLHTGESRTGVPCVIGCLVSVEFYADIWEHTRTIGRPRVHCVTRASVSRAPCTSISLAYIETVDSSLHRAVQYKTHVIQPVVKVRGQWGLSLRAPIWAPLQYCKPRLIESIVLFYA